MKSAIEQSIKEKIKAKMNTVRLPESIEEVISALNQWMNEKAFF